MACYHPLKAWQQEGGGIKFHETKHAKRELTLPCGQCIGCRIAKNDAWATRCVHEAKMHRADTCAFTTATFDEEHYQVSLDYKRDVQPWLKRLRERVKAPFRFYAAGEYGEISGRAHYHILFFGLELQDKVKWTDQLWASKTLTETWRNGQVLSGELNYQTARYASKYTIALRTGDVADSHYLRIDQRTGEWTRVTPEHAHMSRKPGLGRNWFNNYWRDVYVARDGIVAPGGRVSRPPSYYDSLLAQVNPELADEKALMRYIESERYLKDSTPERLKVRETIALARNAAKPKGKH